MLCFFAHFECIFYVFHECPPTNGQTPKLEEIISSKSPISKLGVYFSSFYMKVGN